MLVSHSVCVDVSNEFLNKRINKFRLRQAFAQCCEIPQV